ncbi:MAG: glycoside hydrolase family 2 protein [Bacteroidetes bacterium]|nr:glycoside hydrolase family 2 protein [Bacteroidota bacterium]
MKRLLLIFLLFCSAAYSQVSRVCLSEWEFRNNEENEIHKASVPGTVHTDLLANKLIEDPFYGTNESALQWIEEQEWVYSSSFELTAEQITQKAELVFEGLDTYADVYLNGQKILSADNMFREWRIGCAGFLKEGKNSIGVVFTPPAQKEKTASGEFEKQTGIKEIPGGNRAFTRKAAYHYGWDWSPRFVTCGIWKPAYLEFYNEGKIKDIETVQSILGDNANLTFNVNCLFKTGLKLKLTDDAGKEIVSQEVNDTLVTLNTEIQNPKLWWCNGLGEPYLYKYRLILTDGKKVIDEKTVNIGIRTIELVREKDKFGESFYFRLNGVPVFMKGANFIPTDNFLPRTTKEKYESLIKDAKNSNFNMLRVWGGGIYESDDFYNLCDENGILVWQDFAFACAMVPADKEFAESVREEALCSVKRLRNHPCLALWCGNNEIEEGWNNWGWQNNLTDKQKNILRSAYENIFKNILPSVVSEYNKNANYISSSPKIGWGHKESLTEGDTHYWGVWWGMELFEVYRQKVGRFVSEYGFQGMPDMETISGFAPNSDFYLGSPSLKAHEKHPAGFETIQKYMEMYFNVPERFSDYVKLSQQLQAYSVRTAIEAHRRAKPYCMGTLYWQFNDCNPVVSWSGIDYYGNHKIMQEYVKQAYADILVSPVEEDGKIKVYIVSDRLTDTKGTLEIKFEKFSGIIKSDSYISSVEIKQNSSEVFFEKDAQEVFKKISRTTNFLSAVLRTDDGKIYTNEYLFCKPKEIQIVK